MIKATDEIIITSGSLGSPALLQRSGIGPKKVLEHLHIPILIENDEVGHGVDHTEIAVSYKFLAPKWNEPDGKPPRGGPMAWPVVMFFGDDIMAHFGISPPPYGGSDEVTATPNCMCPSYESGFRAQISSIGTYVILSFQD